jgi:hypothetical protein
MRVNIGQLTTPLQCMSAITDLMVLMSYYVGSILKYMKEALRIDEQ